MNDTHHTFIIAEAASNWKCGNYEDDLKRSQELIKIASKSGADAIKFQTYKPETIYVQNAGSSNYLSQHGINESVNDIFERLSMPYEMISELAKYCKEEKIMFMSTPFSVTDAEEVNPFVEIHKVASFEINHVRLIEYLANCKKPILISSGASTYAEIDFAIELIRKRGNDKIGLMQCTSKYPAPIEALNLSVIPQMKSKYNIPIGLSDHSTDPVVAPLVAIGFGATFIEKHFTIDRNLPGPDHPFALIPEELEYMVKSIRRADYAKGLGIKKVLKEELELQQFAKRSLQATRNISKGDVLREGENFDVLRPGTKSRGLEARFLDKVNGKKAVKDIKVGDGINEYQ